MLTSSILTALHVTLDYFIVINIGGMIILFALVIFLLHKNHVLNKKYKEFMTGEKGYNLEKLVLEHKKEIEQIKENQVSQEEDITTISSHFSELYSKIHIIKYDAFPDIVGKLSFVIVFLDMKNNGFMINSIRSTEGNYVYLKKIENGESEIVLCKEEIQALKEAKIKSV